MYEIFISCKSEDYGCAKEIYNFLCGKGYSVFIADVELHKLGRAQYGKVIDEALEQAKHFVLFASSPDYVMSTYVEDEWRTFLEEQRCGRKKGNLLTIRKGFDVVELPISLRNLQSFTYENFHSIIDYLPINRTLNKDDVDKTDISKVQVSEELQQGEDIVGSTNNSTDRHKRHWYKHWGLFLSIFVLMMSIVFINTNTNTNTNSSFDYKYPYVEGLALVEKDGKFGFVDTTDNVIIPLEYDFAYQFLDGWAKVQKGISMDL
jgi:hypothetical protein